MSAPGGPLALLGLAVIGAVVYGASFGREMRRRQAGPQGELTDLRLHPDPGTGVVLVSGHLKNTGDVVTDYEVSVHISQRAGWTVEYTVAAKELASNSSAPFHLRSGPLNFGTNDIIAVQTVLYSSTGVPLDRKNTSAAAATPGSRPSGEKAAIHWWDKEPEDGWVRPRNRVVRTPHSTVRISRALANSGASGIGASDNMSPNKIFGRSDLVA
jgi:hypothetical protein